MREGGRERRAPDTARVLNAHRRATHTPPSPSPPTPHLPLSPLPLPLPPCCTTLPGPSSAASDPTIVFSPVSRGTEAFLSLRHSPSDNTTPCWQSAHVPTIYDCTVLLRPRVLGHATILSLPLPPLLCAAAINDETLSCLLINHTYLLSPA